MMLFFSLVFFITLIVWALIPIQVKDDPRLQYITMSNGAIRRLQCFIESDIFELELEEAPRTYILQNGFQIRNVIARLAIEGHIFYITYCDNILTVSPFVTAPIYQRGALQLFLRSYYDDQHIEYVTGVFYVDLDERACLFKTIIQQTFSRITTDYLLG